MSSLFNRFAPGQEVLLVGQVLATPPVSTVSQIVTIVKLSKEETKRCGTPYYYIRFCWKGAHFMDLVKESNLRSFDDI